MVPLAPKASGSGSHVRSTSLVADPLSSSSVLVTFCGSIDGFTAVLCTEPSVPVPIPSVLTTLGAPILPCPILFHLPLVASGDSIWIRSLWSLRTE